MIYRDCNGVLVDIPSTRPEIEEKFDGVEISINEMLGEDI